METFLYVLLGLFVPFMAVYVLHRLNILPRFKWKTVDSSYPYSGRNTTFHAWVDRNHPYAKAIVAQEIAESNYKANPLQAIRALFSKKGAQEVELFGRAVEIRCRISEYGETRSIVTKLIAERLIELYPEFDGEKIERVIDRLNRLERKADRWYRKNESRLVKIMENRYKY